MLEALILTMAAAAAPAVAVTDPVAEPNPKAMSQREIRAFNARLPRNHPYYLRCESRAETGSLVKKLYSCRTNEQWVKSDVIGNQEARDTYDEMTSKSWNISN